MNLTKSSLGSFSRLKLNVNIIFSDSFVVILSAVALEDV